MNRYKSRILRNILSSILVVLIFVCSFISLVNISFYFLYTETNVRGFSMQPTINMHVASATEEGDRIFINQHQIGNVNDIVVAKVDWFDSYIIKRMVGKAGDKIEIKDETTHYALYVNDCLLYTKDKYGENTPFQKSGSYGYFESYLNFLTNPEFANYVETDGENTYIKLDENEYFLMGDNWGHTLDCLSKGPIKENNIIGKVELIIDVTNDNPFTPFNFFIKKIFSFN
ncbi:MAG: signal peptidase I [Clostridia bacterium]|nr:signal peptidase I [Clostridia bacterium]